MINVKADKFFIKLAQHDVIGSPMYAGCTMAFYIKLCVQYGIVITL